MGIDRSVGMAMLAMAAGGCGGGAIDGSSTVVTDDGKLHVIADVYGPSATASTPAAGDWTLYEVDVSNGHDRTHLHFLADGQLGLTSVDSRTINDDLHGDRVVPYVPGAWGGPRAARRSCTMANRWRMVDDHRLGVLFTCDDGLGREALFRFPASATSFPPPPDTAGTYELTLEGLGGQPGARMGILETGLQVVRIGLARTNE